MTHSFKAISRFQTGFSIRVFACNNNNDCHTTDKSMRQVALMRFIIKDPAKVNLHEDYTLTISFSFGSTEFHVVAKDDQTGEEVKTDVVFIAD